MSSTGIRSRLRSTTSSPRSCPTGSSSKTTTRRLAACLARNGLPVRCDYDAGALAQAALSDKKRSGGEITLVLPERIGKCYLKKVPVSELPDWFARGLAAQAALGL